MRKYGKFAALIVIVIGTLVWLATAGALLALTFSVTLLIGNDWSSADDLSTSLAVRITFCTLTGGVPGFIITIMSCSSTQSGRLPSERSQRDIPDLRLSSLPVAAVRCSGAATCSPPSRRAN